MPPTSARRDLAGSLHGEINGTDGDLVLTAPDNGNVQATDLTLTGGREEERKVASIPLPPERYGAEPLAALSGPARPVLLTVLGVVEARRVGQGFLPPVFVIWGVLPPDPSGHLRPLIGTCSLEGSFVRWMRWRCSLEPVITTSLKESGERDRGVDRLGRRQDRPPRNRH